MQARGLRRIAAIAGLILAVGAVPAWAGRGTGPASQRPADLWAQARAWIGDLLTAVGFTPSGRLDPTWEKEGPMIDPDGWNLMSRPRCADMGQGCPGENAPVVDLDG
jgi:hypothetical protein